MPWQFPHWTMSDTDELAAAPLKFIDNLHDRYDSAPADTRLM